MSEGSPVTPDGPATDLRFVVGYVVHDGTGKIIQSGQALYLAAVDFAANEENVVLGEGNGGSHYVSGGAITPRPTFTGFDKTSIAADGEDAATMVLPVAAIVTVDGVEYDAPAGPFEFVAEMAGTYHVTVSSFPYRDLAVEIVAT